MKVILTTALIISTSLAFAAELTNADENYTFVCNNDGNENESWSTVPGDWESSWRNAFRACLAQGGHPHLE